MAVLYLKSHTGQDFEKRADKSEAVCIKKRTLVIESKLQSSYESKSKSRESYEENTQGRLFQNKKIWASAERPPRSTEQPLAKSAFSRPKQWNKSQQQHRIHDGESGHAPRVPGLLVDSSSETQIYKDR